ncbi:MAG: ABC transporter substrate-binding protein, partial [Ruminiclostridium sp.]|nr:ABC transporter substrate-binding protein [Ruminiclostridium sp.]
PEIKGLWDFTLVPGTRREDGTVSHANNSYTTGALIFNKVSNQNAAWEFIKWFTSTEAQVEYGRTIEALMGPMGRFATANVEALQQLPWSTSEMEKITAQMSQTVEVPIIPASYATTRHTKNAFRAVVNEGSNARYSLITYNRDINAEIERKNEELSTFDK